ncbi:MAG TPA: hypothetical protein PLQ97_05800 [Myxococcota bacterium]|nr:hypothetical protein [Myxococcota bacterium]HQK50177.1 hypothetical protein [Myxococcota bacterium]
MTKHRGWSLGRFIFLEVRTPPSGMAADGSHRASMEAPLGCIGAFPSGRHPKGPAWTVTSTGGGS